MDDTRRFSFARARAPYLEFKSRKGIGPLARFARARAPYLEFKSRKGIEPLARRAPMELT